jgi:hypothetical protein
VQWLYSSDEEENPIEVLMVSNNCRKKTGTSNNYLYDSTERNSDFGVHEWFCQL